MNNPEVGNLKKAFARQRAKDLAERAKLLMNKDNEINHLKKEVEETCHNGFNEVQYSIYRAIHTSENKSRPK